MTIDEASRLHLYERARNASGDAAADTLMTALPHDPGRFATADDLDALGIRLDAKIDALGIRLDAKIDVLEANLRREITSANSNLLRTLFFGMAGTNATLVGLVFAAVRLA